MIDAKELLEKIKTLRNKQLPNATRDKLEQVCLFIEGESKKNCPPSVTGNLRASITYSIEEDEEGKLVGYVGSNLDYAPYVHQGTGIYALEGKGRQDVPWTYKDERTGEYVSTEGIHPTPFIQMAIDENREQIIQYFKGVLDDIGTNNSDSAE